MVSTKKHPQMPSTRMPGGNYFYIARAYLLSYFGQYQDIASQDTQSKSVGLLYPMKRIRLWIPKAFREKADDPGYLDKQAFRDKLTCLNASQKWIFEKLSTWEGLPTVNLKSDPASIQL